MLECQVQGSEVTYSSMLHACCCHGTRQSDSFIVRENYFMTRTLAGNALIDMYAKCGSIRDACSEFKILRERDQVSWVTMIAGYSVHGPCGEALKAFELMQETECKLNKVTFVGRLGHLDKTVKLVKEIPFVPSAMVWWSLLSACVVHNDVELGRISAQHVLEMELEDEATHAILLNIYANARRWGKCGFH
ncbi:hypothetical protein OIU85_025326 [Salix viminalis]|uniref:Pentatricopeptide repeat-containing protein n=1 Tax=Salix viminalis TaxID=40686 RepID=A0A9Q0TL93_SALVM|nr:hypothetical protein OIU85_025326 [Salix viminalis]